MSLMPCPFCGSMVADQAHGICPKCGGQYEGATEKAKQEAAYQAEFHRHQQELRHEKHKGIEGPREFAKVAGGCLFAAGTMVLVYMLLKSLIGELL